jgi:cysteine desulfurase
VTRAYLDHAAAAPLDPRVRAAMLPFLAEDFGSPASLHAWGARPAAALAEARAAVAALVGAEPERVVFTSGATEARNLAVLGLLAATRPAGGAHAVASAVEHPATLAAAHAAVGSTGALAVAGVDGEGRIDPEALGAALRPDTALVSLVHAQPDLGTVQDVPALVAVVRERAPEALVFVDAGASAGLLDVDMAAMGADALALDGGPMAGPVWAGALILAPGTPCQPLIRGGGQEAGLRAGAEALPGIVGLGAAARLARSERAERAPRMAGLGERLIRALLAVPDVRLTGPRRDRLPGHASVVAGGVESETLTLALAARGVACSPGAACTSDARKSAPALEAIGLEPPWTHSAVLFTCGPATGQADVDHAGRAFAAAVASLRELSPLTP